MSAWLSACGGGETPGGVEGIPPGEAEVEAGASGQGMGAQGVGISEQELEMVPLVAASASGSSTLFESLSAEETGVDFVNHLKKAHHIPFLNTGAGVALGDYDGDGRTDLYLVSTDGKNRLFRQVTQFRFEDTTDLAGVDGGEAWSRGAAFADIDGDGDLDLYVCNTEAPNLLYLNRGDGTFEEAAQRFGLDLVAASIMAYFADYDRDGDIDMYLVTYRALKQNLTDGQIADIEIPADTVRSRSELKVQPVRARRAGDRQVSLDPEQWNDLNTGNWELSGQLDRLFRNEGDGTFTDVTEAAGLVDYGLGLSATWMDFDGDGWLDLHVANDLTTRDRLYRNQGDGTFGEELSSFLPHTPWYSMGSDVADVNNDGLLDFLVADMAGSDHYRGKVGMGDMSVFRTFMEREWPRQLMRNSLFLNTGRRRFMEVAPMAGIAATDWTWSVKFGDFDNDGRADVFFTNGSSRDDMNIDRMGIRFMEVADQQGEAAALEYLKTIPTAPTPNLAYRNLGDLRFEHMGARWGLDHDGVSFGAATADLDRDGDLDLVVNHLNEPVGIYRNTVSQGHRVLVRLRGAGANSFGYGAKVTVRSPEVGIQVQQMLPARGFMSSDEPILHFGLGADSRLEELEIDWPSGRTQTFRDLPADQLLQITEPVASRESPTMVAESTVPAESQFEELATAAGLTWTHRETPYDDFAVQELLPGKLSQLGPGVAVGDANGDGIEDLFLAGAGGQAGRLFLHRGDGTFVASEGPWTEDRGAEDMAPLWLDVEGDGDLDLLVTSGGVEFPEGDSKLRDRLYLNDGAGRFRPGKARLPPISTSTSTAAAADFDGDGDLDLFLGGRTIPGRYPLAPGSHLLRNDRGRFREVTADLAPALQDIGMVTSALWSDGDGDGRLDLFVTLEWGAVHFFRNRGDGF